jgi:predicted MPP superfamily phosphohydrolase
MSLSEKLRVAVLVAGALAIYLAALGLAIHAVGRWARRRRGELAPPLRRTARVARALVWSLAGIGVVGALYAGLVEPRWLEVTHVEVATARLSPGARSIRIVHISDVHADAGAGLEARLPTVIAAQHPDVIVFTGDALNDAAGLPRFRRLMTELARVAPTFAVRGNWDVHRWDELDLFGTTGARELDGTAASIALRGGVELWLAGAADGSPERLDRALTAIPPDAPRVMLYHHPDQMPRARAAGVDLYCAGHTHGGQIALPWYGAIITMSKDGKRYEAGLYREGATSLYVNRGIGVEGGGSPRVRFFARPEVTVIDLVPAEAARRR